jgi:hypothetical protein
MPEKVYAILWSFLLDSSNTSETDGCLLDFKSIASLMLISRASKGAFDACRGWLICAQALEQEAVAKRQILHPYQKRGLDLLRYSYRVVQLNNPGRFFALWHRDLMSWLDEKERMREIIARIIRIHSEFFPQARRLADSYRGCQVYMHPFDIWLAKNLSLLVDSIEKIGELF